MVESSVGQRFSQLIQQLGMSKNAFAMSLDKTATVIQHLVDERNKPGFDLMCKVFEVYPNVSKDWLLMGKGPMLSNVDAPAPALPSPTYEPAIAVPAAVAKPLAPPATPHFPEPLFAVSAARPPVAELPVPPAAPLATPPQEIAPATQPMAAQALGTIPAEGQAVAPSPAPSASLAVPATPVASPDATALTAALHAQYLQHQLALAEQRNQHLLEQQQLMQQMLELMRQNR